MKMRIENLRAGTGVVFLALAFVPIEGGFAESTLMLTNETLEAIREGTRREFGRSRFCKPRKVDSSLKGHEFAPLIVEELSESKSTIVPPMHLRNAFADRTLFKPATVYFHKGEVKVSGQELEQILFLWAYPRRDGGWGPELRANIRGVRVILGTDGMPVVWEAIGGVMGNRVFYVANSIENAAKQEFGEPFPGRHFSIERGAEVVPNVVVARVLDDGPVPMGPYVYVDASSERNVTTLHCRCSPSQFDEVAETLEYELLPLDDVDEKWIRERLGVDLEKLRDCDPLETLLRWPKMTP